MASMAAGRTALGPAPERPRGACRPAGREPDGTGSRRCGSDGRAGTGKEVVPLAAVVCVMVSACVTAEPGTESLLILVPVPPGEAGRTRRGWSHDRGHTERTGYSPG